MKTNNFNYYQGYEEEPKKKPSMVAKVLLSPLTYSTLMLIFASALYASEQNKEPPQNELSKKIQTIETNIEKSHALEKFEFVAIQGKEWNNQYFVTVGGSALKSPNETAKFAHLSYQIDENMYGILTGKNNENKSNEEQYNDLIFVLTVLTELTKQKAQYYQETLPEAKPGGYTQLSTDDFFITSVSKPKVDKESQTVLFQIQAVTKQELQSDDTEQVNLKTFEISAPLSKELLENPNKIFEEYIKGSTNFKTVKEDNLILQNFDYLHIETHQKSNNSTRSL